MARTMTAGASATSWKVIAKMSDFFFAFLTEHLYIDCSDFPSNCHDAPAHWIAFGSDWSLAGFSPWWQLLRSSVLLAVVDFPATISYWSSSDHLSAAISDHPNDELDPLLGSELGVVMSKGYLTFKNTVLRFPTHAQHFVSTFYQALFNRTCL